MAGIKEPIIRTLKERYCIEVATLELLSLGADRNASVYRAESADDNIYFIKIRQDLFSKAHIEVLSLLQQAGVKEIISPIRTRDGKQVEQVGDFSLIVYPFIEGQNGFNCSLSDQQWIQLGKTLRQIHEIEVPKAIQKHIRLEDFSPKWRETIRSFYSSNSRIEEESDEVGMEFRESLKGHQEVIERLLSRAEWLSKKIETRLLPFVLCHSDIHAGNLLLEKEDIFYLIDWDDPIMAPKERDLMFIGGGVGNVWNQPHEEMLFYEGYGKTELNPLLLAYYRHERIVVDIVEYTEELLFKHGDSKDKAEMYKHFTGMFEPRGVVDIALQAKLAL